MKSKFLLLPIVCVVMSGCGVDWFPDVSNNNNSGTDNSNLAVPTLRSSLSPASIDSGGTSTLTLTIYNQKGNPAQSGLGYAETLPAGVTATVISNQCGGSLDFLNSKLVLMNGTLAAGTPSCTMTANLTATNTGSAAQNFTLKASDFDPSQFQGTPGKLANGVSNQTLTVTPVTTPTLTAALDPAALIDGTTTGINLTITNAPSNPAQTGLGFTESIPVGLVATNPVSHCGGTVSVNNAGQIVFSGGQLSSGVANCTVTANLGLGPSLLSKITSDQTFTIANGDFTSLQGGLANGVTNKTLNVFSTSQSFKTSGGVTVVVSNLQSSSTGDATTQNYTFNADTSNDSASSVSATVDLIGVDVNGAPITSTDNKISFSVPPGLLTSQVLITIAPIAIPFSVASTIRLWRILSVTVP